MDAGAKADLSAALDRLAQAKATIASLVRCKDADCRREIVEQRRLLSEHITAVGAAGERAFAGSAELATFRTKWSAMRLTTLLHQANWPAVLLGKRPDEFRASTEPMRQAGADFLSWTRAALQVSDPRRMRRPLAG